MIFFNKVKLIYTSFWWWWYWTTWIPTDRWFWIYIVRWFTPIIIWWSIVVVVWFRYIIVIWFNSDCIVVWWFVLIRYKSNNRLINHYRSFVYIVDSVSLNSIWYRCKSSPSTCVVYYIVTIIVKRAIVPTQ